MGLCGAGAEGAPSGSWRRVATAARRMKPELYAGRPLTAGVTSLESRGADIQDSNQTTHPFTKGVIECVDRPLQRVPR